MNNADDLRIDVAAVIYSWGKRVLSWDGVCEYDWDERDQFLAYADDVLAVLTLPSHGPAILNLIGDVTEGWACQRMNNAPICPGEHQCTCENPDPQPVFVVRPRGEATDG